MYLKRNSYFFEKGAIIKKAKRVKLSKEVSLFACIASAAKCREYELRKAITKLE
ncbi:hypothetical protein LOB71_00585 [Lactobacillus delbrueckii subsp. lactis]|jgi:hypothetical protein|uniref:hypothetical protein n=1 Tax=Lactobacillus delbrueckii TaxID=1584 RepID=UPI000A711C30|nr:hypothetical protein [Lactobacillus delbrueckii]MBO1174608.1 hypothetical protein [Lactobacillus delbrueckii subsp. lactis]MBO1183495.1 hypothetical protein [Lactobacillus delbrueckii subsp. lactis]MCD5488900.1 hypothetical protein [Lactobacillus delbrueckii subsp. lactis]MCD5492661.1 hypothetical protein [Lactobacillus delbrueckii subsp. lactis]MCD5508867.1 hypothetical protein [Lactobacillus delbrueckii subsp. lactis]